MNLGLFLNPTQTKGRQLLRGIYAELENWPGVEIRTIPESLRLWEGNPLSGLDAVLGEFDSPRRLEPFRKLKLPIINLSNALQDSPFPRSIMDEQRIGSLAARHLLDRGYEQFICLALWEHNAAGLRAKAFCSEIEKHGRKAEILWGAFVPQMWDTEKIVEAVGRMAPPIGIFGWTDFSAYAAFQAAQALDREVPEEIGIMGSGDDDVFTSITRKPMTSIHLHWESVGAAAVDMLREALSGKRSGDRHSTRSELVPRASTERHPVSDPRLARCLSHIERELNGNLSVPELAWRAGCSKRALEENFRKELNTSPASYVLGRRVARAQRLLRETDLRIYEIAAACGFEDANYFAAAFKRVTGTSPTAYREQATE